MKKQTVILLAVLAGVLAGCDHAGPLGEEPSARHAPDETLAADGSATNLRAVYPGAFEAYRYAGRRYVLYTPTSYDGQAPVPLVVALHGCAQSPEQFAVDTDLNRLAEARGFLVVYPEQSRSANPGRCWNWFEAEHQQRGRGEPGLLAGLVRQVQDLRAVDATRVFALGFSAGGAMAAVLGVTYPDLFAGISVHAGVMYMGGIRSAEAARAMSTGFGPDPTRQGERAFQAMGPRARPVRVIAFQGAADLVVKPANVQALTAQWLRTNVLAAEADALTKRVQQGRVPGGRYYTRTQYRGAGFTVEHYLVWGMSHRYAGGSGEAEWRGGTALTDPWAPPASAWSLDFFGIPANAGVRSLTISSN